MKHLQNTKPASAFTLIELLIVVAIIAILAAIAVPNFLEAQTRAKVSRAKADMRTIITGLESYRVDNSKYPNSAQDLPFAPLALPQRLNSTVYVLLTSPISYLTTYPEDAFKGDKSSTNPVLDPLKLRAKYDYRKVRLEPLSASESTFQESNTGFDGSDIGQDFPQWLLYSPGPDREQNINTGFALNNSVAVANFGDSLADWPYYDSSNGTISVGDIVRSSIGDETSMINR